MTRLPLLSAGVLLASMLLAAAATPVAAQQSVYQWKDAQGVTHFSDSPPAGTKYTNRAIHQNGAAGSETAATEDGKPAENDNCKMARNNLQRLDSGVAIGIDRDGDGKPDANLSPEERDAQRQLNEAAVKVACGQG